MKKITLLLVLCFLSFNAYAQKSITKNVCRVWVPDKEAMLKEYLDTDDYDRMKKDMAQDRIFLYFKKDGKLFLGERKRATESAWQYNADKKEIFSDKAVFKIKELTDKKFTFVLEKKGERALYFIPASKQEEKEIKKMCDSIPSVPPPPPPFEGEKKD